MRRWRTTAFGLALMVLSVIGVLGYENSRALDAAFTWVEHTYEVRAQLELVKEALLGAENARRAFSITNDESHLADFDEALARSEAALARVRTLTMDNESQQRRLDELAPRLEARKSGLRAAILARQNGADADAERKATTDGSRQTAGIVAAIAAMDGEEQRLLALRLGAARAGSRKTVAIIATGTALAFAMLTVVFVLLRREIGARTREIAQRIEAEEERDKFFDLGIDMLAIASLDGRFLRVNPSFTRVLGYSPEELTAGPFLDFVHPDDRASTNREAEKLASGALTIGFENRYRCKDASYRWLQWSVVPDLERGVLYAAARDATDQKTAQLEIAKLNDDLAERVRAITTINEELESFSYSVSHDLRSPLRGIDGFSQALLEDYGDKLDATGVDYLNRVRKATQRMGQLIDDLLKLSQITRATLCREPVDVSAIARSIFAELQRAHPERKVEVEVTDGLSATADPKLVRIAFDNLLRNAWKFTSKVPAARIEVGAHVNGGTERAFFVKDNGAGFDMAHAKNLFGAFQRLHAARDFEGTGIGLATVRRVVARHDGRIWADAKVGEGATFYFTL